MPEERRGSRVFDTLPDDAEDAIIEMYKENPFLHDMKNESYKNREKRDRILSEKAEDLKNSGINPCNADMIQRWFRSHVSGFAANMFFKVLLTC